MACPSEACPFAFRIIGPTTGIRRCVVAGRAWEAYLDCDPKAEVNREGYLSAFTFGEDFRTHLSTTGSTADFGGTCSAAFVWWDIDRDDIDVAQADAARLCGALAERFKLDLDADVLAFISGSKGFHVGLPTLLWTPSPSTRFNRIARAFAERVANDAGVQIDSGVYDKVRAFRAPNSLHPKTSKHKVQVTPEALMHLSASAILDSAREPFPIEWSFPAGTCADAADLWDICAQDVERLSQARAAVPPGTTPSTLNRGTLNFIRNGAGEGDRHRLLFSSAANLAEFGCTPALAHALLSEAGLDSGLPPKEVTRQIECGLKAKAEVPHG